MNDQDQQVMCYDEDQNQDQHFDVLYATSTVNIYNLMCFNQDQRSRIIFQCIWTKMNGQDQHFDVFSPILTI